MPENIQNYGVYSLYDYSTEEYGLPFVSVSTENALRSVVSSIIHLDDNVINDLGLFEIGQYDKEKAKIVGHELNISVAGSDYILKKVYQAREELEAIKKEALAEYEELRKLKSEVK